MKQPLDTCFFRSPLKLNCFSNYGYVFAVCFCQETDRSGFEREKRVISAASYIQAGMKLSAALADDYGSGVDLLPVAAFDAKIFWITVAAVSAASLSFFMCHELFPPTR